MWTAIFALLLVLTTWRAVHCNARRQGFPFAAYLGSLLAVILVAVGGIFLGVFALQRLDSGPAATAAFLFVIAATSGLSIWVCVILFTRLKKKYPEPPERSL